MKRLLFLLFFASSLNCFAQIETETHIFWQPNVKLTFDMFEGNPNDSTVLQYKNVNVFHVIALGCWGNLDVPQTKRDKKKLAEKYYFCAAMDKKKSFWIVRDSTELKYAQLLWDVCELATRVSRKNLADVLNGMYEGKKGKGGAALMYMTCYNDGKEFGDNISDAIFKKVICPRNEDEYQNYRKQVDDLLAETKEFATTEEEIKRFISKTPDEGYIMAPTIVGDLKNRGTIRY